MVFNFIQQRREAEAEGVFIGGWSIRNAVWPKGDSIKKRDEVEHVSAVRDWDEEEERRLVRKLDTRVLLPCCIVYFLAYLDRVRAPITDILGSCER
jgi:hypothetical protein